MNDVQRFPLRDIIRDPACQPREGLDKEHVEDIREAKAAGRSIPPVVIYCEEFSLGKRNYYLSEGFHRVEAYDLDAEEFIEAIVRDGTLDDAIVNAMGSNADHGLKRKAGDKRRAVEAVLKYRPTWSDRMVADHVKVSNGYVSQIHREMEEKLEKRRVPTEERKPVVRTGKDGISREVVKKEKPEPVIEIVVPEEGEQPEAKPAIQPGKPKFDNVEWGKRWGSTVRLINEIANATGTYGSNEHRAVMQAAQALTISATQWRESLTRN